MDSRKKLPDHPIYQTFEELWNQTPSEHEAELPLHEDQRQILRNTYEESHGRVAPSPSGQRRPSPVSDFQFMLQAHNCDRSRRSATNQHSAVLKRLLEQPTRSLTELGKLSLREKVAVDRGDSNVEVPRKRVAIAPSGSASLIHDSTKSSSTLASNPEAGYEGHQTDDSQKLWMRDDSSNQQHWSAKPFNNISNHAGNTSRQPFKASLAKASFQRLKQIFRQLQSPTRSPGSQPSTPITSKDVEKTLPLLTSRPISQEQLVGEVKGIYAGLVMVEQKCVEVDSRHATLGQADPSNLTKLDDKQWQAMIALHRTLLYEHHDFLLASQHPSASPALRRLAVKYAMPARMWRHGIHSFLELLRHRLPAALDHMLSFICLAYSMMALLYETVPEFQDTWIECLGDLGRYRMAIEDDLGDRETWASTSRGWYRKELNRCPGTGRLYHHLAVLARPDGIKQVFLYSKSLFVVDPFASTKDSILALFESRMAQASQSRYEAPLDILFIELIGYIFPGRSLDVNFEQLISSFVKLLSHHLGKYSQVFLQTGPHTAITICVALLGFKQNDNALMQILFPKSNPNVGTQVEDPCFQRALLLFNKTSETYFARIRDQNALPFCLVILVFLKRAAQAPRALDLIAHFPWTTVAVFLNTVLGSLQELRTDESSRCLPEDLDLRGLLFADDYPDSFFDDLEDEGIREDTPSMSIQRKKRCLRLGRQICRAGIWLNFDGKSQRFYTGTLECRVPTFACATTTSDGTESWDLLEGTSSDLEETASMIVSEAETNTDESVHTNESTDNSESL